MPGTTSAWGLAAIVPCDIQVEARDKKIMFGWLGERRRRAHAAAAMRTVFAEQKRLVDETEEDPGPQTREKCVRGLRVMDITACPVDFQVAFRRYVEAFEQLTDAVAETEGFWGGLGGLLESVRRFLEGGVSEYEAKRLLAYCSVIEAWSEVLIAAVDELLWG